ncbi:unnamed protein product [Diatraea saccharalis]|uniref:Uncharacterized protein n=1 Tax=Diatraea saccharalis TaxID=40085 RepID=A0A9N9W8T3_9NEOP|nr:unnamed protein product [Diatraea saccharalis]
MSGSRYQLGVSYSSALEGAGRTRRARCGDRRRSVCARELGQGGIGCIRLGVARAPSGESVRAGVWLPSIAAHAAQRRSSAPRVATRVPGLAPQRWRRERAPPAASGGHAAMAREVTATRPAPGRRPPSLM